MRKNDTGGLWPVAVAFALLTRLPLPRLPDAAFAHQARAAWAFALVGLVVGAVVAGIGIVALWSGLPATAAAGLVLTVQMVLTGAMHEDGLADTADGFWGGYTPDRRLEIMRDSQIGTYGVLALILVTGLRWMAIAALLGSGIAGLLAVAALSRGVLPALMTGLPPARGDGLSASVGQPSWRVALTSLALACVLAFGLLGAPALVLLVVACGAAAGVSALARVKIGGQTGDVLGATQQLSETAMLLTLVLLL